MDLRWTIIVHTKVHTFISRACLHHLCGYAAWAPAPYSVTDTLQFGEYTHTLLITLSMPMIISPIISPHHPSNKLIGRYRNFIMYVHFHKKWQSIMGVSGCERLVTINVRFPHIFYMTAKLCQPGPYVEILKLQYVDKSEISVRSLWRKWSIF